MNSKMTAGHINRMEAIIFASRWLQAPLYLGLIVAQVVYVYKFFNELKDLAVGAFLENLSETTIMLSVLGLIDVVMVANLLIMVIVGGYETFVSRINLKDHPDQPEWLAHMNAGVLKVKLATAIIAISSIHLLKTFFNAENTSDHTIFWQVIIHSIFVFSAIAMVYVEKLMSQSTAAKPAPTSH
jgi:uncharacterized protein (TIGR00645 family)